MSDRCICPICFNQYPVAMSRSKWPFCPDCGSEAMEIELVPLDDFLRQNGVAELRRQLKKWSAAEGFYEAYKNAKIKRMERVIAMALKREKQLRGAGRSVPGKAKPGVKRKRRGV